MTLTFTDRDVETALSPADALRRVSQAFRLLANGDTQNEPRHRMVHAADATLNVMWAMSPELDLSVVKAYPIARTDVRQASVITITAFEVSTGRCVALVKGDALGRLRTAATSALATSLMARPDSSRLALYGTGFQASAHVRALVDVLPSLRALDVVGRDPHRRDVLVRRLRAAHPDLSIESAHADLAAERADVIVTATSAVEPVFDGARVRPGTHINAVGSNHAGARELDRTIMTNARVVVDSHPVAALESGDLLRNGRDPATAVEMQAVVVGLVPGRESTEEITVFESQGLAVLDLVCVRHLLDTAVFAASTPVFLPAVPSGPLTEGVPA